MMSSPAMAENFPLPVNVEQLTCVVNSMVEVSSDGSGGTTTPFSNVNLATNSTTTTSPTTSSIDTSPATTDNQPVTDSCLPHILQTQASGLMPTTNSVPSLHIPVSLTGHSISMLPLMYSLNLPHRSLISAIDKAPINRASIHTAPAPITFPSVMASTIQREADSCSTMQDMNILECVQTVESSDDHHHHHLKQHLQQQHHNIEGCSSPAAGEGQQAIEETSHHNPNHPNALITTNMQATLQNQALVTSSLSNLSDIQFGMGIIPQNDPFSTSSSSMPDTQLSPLLQAANQFNQTHAENNKSSAADAPVVANNAGCIMQQNGATLELTNGTAAAGIAAGSLSSSAANLQSIMNTSSLHHHHHQYHHHQQQQQQEEHCSNDAASSFTSIGMVTNKLCDGNSTASSALLDVNNMSVIDMILKVHQNGAAIAAASTATDIDKDNDLRSAVVASDTSNHLGIDEEEDMSTFVIKHSSHMSFNNFCLECNSNNNNSSSKDLCQIHSIDYCDIPDSPILSRARLSLPYLLYLKNTSAHGYSDTPGVWSKEPIPCRSRFGPLVARLKGKCSVDIEKISDFPIWMIFSMEGPVADVLDVSDENECNWMMFVKPARTPEEQNLVAYQQQYSIYFMTCCDVQPHQELLVWYANDYASALGVPQKANVTLSCCVCSKIFASQKLLAQHIRSVHPDVTSRRLHCQFCNRGFTSTTKLKTHLLTHIGAKPHSCSQCGKRFTDQSNLRMHLYIHTGERKFACSICKKQFRQKAHLTSHMFTHTGEKKLQCQFCEKMFSRSSDLKQHQYQHTREKLYNCSHCDKSFYKIQNFKKHLKIHSGERNYTCVKCPKSFYTKYHLKRHSGTCKGSRNPTAVAVATPTAGDDGGGCDGGGIVSDDDGGGGGGDIGGSGGVSSGTCSEERMTVALQSESCDLLRVADTSGGIAVAVDDCRDDNNKVKDVDDNDVNEGEEMGDDDDDDDDDDDEDADAVIDENDDEEADEEVEDDDDDDNDDDNDDDEEDDDDDDDDDDDCVT